MNSYFDSSTLVAAFVREEEDHEKALRAFMNEKGFTSTHALAEVYASLTSGRLPVRLPPATAIEVIETNVIGRLDVLELRLDDYRAALRASEQVGARGGAVYDLLHLQAARRGNADRILTLNLRHFQTFAPDLRDIIAEP